MKNLNFLRFSKIRKTWIALRHKNHTVKSQLIVFTENVQKSPFQKRCENENVSFFGIKNEL